MANEWDFRIEPAKAIQQAKVSLKHFKDHLSTFSAFDADFNAAFIADMEAAIAAAEQHPTDETVRDQLQGFSKKVKQETAHCDGTAADVRFYVDKAFPQDETMLGEFGYRALRNTRPNTPAFIIWMKVLHSRAVKYQTPLTDNGMTAADIAAILTRAQALEQAELNQEMFKRERLQLTAQRTQLYNAMWRHVTLIEQAARRIYAGNDEMLSLFKA